MKKIIAVLLVAMLLIGLTAGCGGGSNKGQSEGEKVYELHAAYATPDSEYDQHSMLFKMFKEEVEQKTNGQVKIILHPAGELGGEREYVEMLQSGDLAFADVACSVLNGFTNELSFLDMPYLFRDGEQAYEFFQSDLAREKLNNLEGIGLVGVALSTAGSRNFLTVKGKTIESVDDFKGLKIRVMETPMHIEAMTLFGTQPTPMAYTETYQALQTNTIDGMENQIPTYISNRLYEVAPNYAMVGWFHQNHAFIASKKIMDELPQEYQEIIMEVGQRAANLASEFTIDFDKGEGLEKLKELGVNITYPDTTVMFEKAQTLKEKYKDLIGEDVIKWLDEN